MSVEEVIIPGVSTETRMPDLRSDEEMFPHIVAVDDRTDDAKTAEIIDTIGDLFEQIVGKNLSGRESQESLVCLIDDPIFQQVLGFAEKAAA